MGSVSSDIWDPGMAIHALTQCRWLGFRVGIFPLILRVLHRDTSTTYYNPD